MLRYLLCLGVLAATIGSARAIETGLVAHWTFDEGEGDVARDVTGNGHDAAVENVDWVPSPRGHALRFDSKDDLARYGQVDTMNLSGDMTLAVWVKTDASVEPGTNRIIIGDTGVGIERNLNLRMDGYLRFEWADGTANASLLAPAALLNGTWKHVAVVADCGRMLARMYVDGRQVADMAMPLPISTAPVKERLTGWFYNGYFQGELDDIRLYSRALSEEEVGRLYASEAEVEIGGTQVLFDTSDSPPVGVCSLALRNHAAEARRLSLSGGDAEAQELLLEPGARTQIAIGRVSLTPVWEGRTDLFICDETSPKLTVTTHRGDATDTQQVSTAAQLALEPFSVLVRDPWQPQAAGAKDTAVAVNLAVPGGQLAHAVLRLRLVSRETGQEALVHEVHAPSAATNVTLHTAALPWGAYDMTVSLRNADGTEVASTQRLVTVLPDGAQRIRPLNNLVSELLNAKAAGLLSEREIPFMAPRDGWVWFRTAGECELRLGDEGLLSVAAGESPAEAMRLLPAGKHTLRLTGTPTDLTVRAVPALLYNVYPSSTQIQPFGGHTWDRLSQHTLPNTNTIESQVIDTPEHRQWRQRGGMWIANIQAPGLVDKRLWTAEEMLEVWRKPRNWSLAAIDGIQVDEYYPGNPSTENVRAATLSIARLSQDPAFAGKLWIPFVVNMHGSPTAELFMKTSLGCGWPFSVEVYVGEEPGEEKNLQAMASRFRAVAQDWERAYPGSMRRAIFTPMYSYLPYCTTNRSPEADFRVHLDMQMQLLATDPAFFGLFGVQPYRSNYVDEEIQSCMGLLLRHYCIEGKTERMLEDPYELAHVTDPDFAEGTSHWQVAAAEEGSVGAGKFAGYGTLQGRYPGPSFGDTFLLMTRSDRRPNIVRQELAGLTPGRLYSLKLITGDYADLTGGQSRKDTQVLRIDVEGAEVLPGGFSHPFRSARGPQPFTMQSPFWMTYHRLQFRALEEPATLILSDWATGDTPGGPVGQQMMVSFVELQPVLEVTGDR